MQAVQQYGSSNHSKLLKWEYNFFPSWNSWTSYRVNANCMHYYLSVVFSCYCMYLKFNLGSLDWLCYLYTLILIGNNFASRIEKGFTYMTRYNHHIKNVVHTPALFSNFFVLLFVQARGKNKVFWNKSILYYQLY